MPSLRRGRRASHAAAPRADAPSVPAEAPAKPAGGTALVTGASSGIGEAFARALAARGHDLVLVARRRDRLEGLAAALRAPHGVSVEVVVADLSKPLGVDDVTQAVDRLGLEIELLVNNAGFGSYGAFAELPLGRELEMIDLNVRALVALTGHVLPGMLERRHGTIVNIASTTSFQPVPYMAVYGASKAFVLHFSEAVAQECAQRGVRVLAVCPGHTPTEFQRVSGVDRRPSRTSSQSVDEVVREALGALDGDAGDVVVTGLPNTLTPHAPRRRPRRALGWLIERAFRPRG
jgi:short-subunit dehydrogenase